MSGRYSAFALVKQSFAGHKGWPQAWRKAKPKPAYDFVIVGGGGHGLATAYYLAKTHKSSRVCVIEKGWLGGGNTGRNTTVVRSNYFYAESVALYDLALRLYEGLSRELNFNVMLSQRGILNLAHTPAQLEMAARLTNAMQLNGVDAELWGPNEIRERLPLMTQSLNSRYLPNGGVWQRRGGIARHDAVAWGYARAADRLGVDIVENCEATGFMMQNGACVGVETSLGEIRAEAVGVAVAGHSSQLLAKAGVKLPIHSYTLQAMVSEPVKPCLDIVVLHLGTGVYLSQSDKGEIVFGGGLDRIPSYGQRGSPPMQEIVVSGLLDMFPAFGQLKLMRQWGGIVDVVPNSSPIIGPAPKKGIFLNCGWGTGGFKAIPAGGTLLAHLLATGAHHEISRPFDLVTLRGRAPHRRGGGLRNRALSSAPSFREEIAMYIAMNRFKVMKGAESAFEHVWLSRDTHLDRVPGFIEFHLLRGPERDDHVLYSSHTVWASKDAFTAWTQSEHFRAAHRDAGANKPLYLGHPEFEGFEVLQTIKNSRDEAA